jgi:thiol-disulfide isomerase/thioredoxin
MSDLTFHSSLIKPSALQEAVATNAVTLFYADWCGHCQRMKPVFEQVAGELKGGESLPHVHYTRMDYDKYGGEVTQMNIGAEEFGSGVHTVVKGFPTILFFSKEGRTSQYQGGPDPATLSAAIREFFQGE